MPNYDSLVVDFFLKKATHWANNKNDAIAYLKNNPYYDLANEFKTDDDFRLIKDFVQLKEGITLESTEIKNIASMISKWSHRRLEKSETEVLLEKLIKSIEIAINSPNIKTNKNKEMAITLAASVALVAILTHTPKNRSSSKTGQV